MIRVFWAEVVRTFQEERAYLFQWFASVATTFIFIYGLAFAFKFFGRDYRPITGANLLIGIVVWFFASKAISRMSYYILEECTIGTIESLYLSPVNPVFVYINRAISQVILGIITITLIAAVFIVTEGIQFNIEPVSAVVVILITLVGIYGFGFALAGMTIIYKRTSSFASIIDSALLFFAGVIIPLDNFPSLFQTISKYLPLTLGIKLLRAAALDGLSFRDAAFGHPFLWLLGNSLFYLLLGVAIYNYADYIARRRGVISRY